MPIILNNISLCRPIIINNNPSGSVEVPALPITRAELDVMIANGDDVTKVNTSEITDFNRLFRGNTTFNQDIGGWDVSSGTDFDLMFADSRGTPCVFNQDISSWNMSSAETCQSMFLNNTVFQSDLSNWVVDNVHTMFNMFTNASSFSSDLSAWNVANVTNHDDFSVGSGTVVEPTWADTSLTRAELDALIVANVQADIESANVSQITDFSNLFANKTTFNYDISGWDTGSAITMERMFQDADAFTGNIDGWDVSNVVTMQKMFLWANNFNSPLSSWDTSSVINMKGMFLSAPLFSQDLSAWEVSQVTDHTDFAAGAGTVIEPSWNGSPLTRAELDTMIANGEDYSNANTSAITDFSYTFFAIEVLFDISGWDTSAGTTFHSMFRNAPNFTQDLSAWDVSSGINFTDMFYSTTFAGHIENWDLSSAWNLDGMFLGCNSITADLTTLDVTNVQTMSRMFSSSNFNQNIAGWNVSNVSIMSNMFSWNSVFNQDISGWNVGTVQNFGGMFKNASSFAQDLTGWDVSSSTYHTDFGAGANAGLVEPFWNIILTNFTESSTTGSWYGCNFDLAVAGSIPITTSEDIRITQIGFTQAQLDNYKMVFTNIGTLNVGDIDIDYWANGSLISSQTNTPTIDELSLVGHPTTPDPLYVGFWLNGQTPPAGFGVTLTKI